MKATSYFSLIDSILDTKIKSREGHVAFRRADLAELSMRMLKKKKLENHREFFNWMLDETINVNIQGSVDTTLNLLKFLNL